MKPGIQEQVKSLSTINSQNLKKKQNGIVLLVLIIAIALTVSAYYFSNISIVDIQTDNIQKTRVALKAAKKALIGYATVRSDLTDPSFQPAKYGYLPCPANNNGDGNSMGSCGGAKKSTIGWFPWRSLGMAPLKDSNGDCLLYAVSSTYKYDPEANMLNEDTNFGMFQVVDENDNIIYGDTAQNRVVAIVFSAGKALSGQNRNKDPDTECGEDVNNFSAYLDAIEVSPGDTVNNSNVDDVNTNRVDRFVQVASGVNEEDFNDQLIVITRDEIWPQAITHRTSAFDIADMTGASKVRRLTEALARCLASYANDNNNSSLPFPAPLDFAGGDYRDNANYTDTSSAYVGRFPYDTSEADDVPVPGAVADSTLFDKIYGGPIDPPIPPDLPTGIWQCTSLLIGSPVAVNANLSLSTTEDRRFWDNWKDHIIYAVSERYAARALPSDDLIQPRCDDIAVSNNKCITFNGTKYAAIVMYSGGRLVDVVTDPGPPVSLLTQVRDAPVAFEDAGIVIDTKQDINNYIEVTGPINSGSGDGSFTPEAYNNDLYFCLTDTEPVDVIECI